MKILTSIWMVIVVAAVLLGVRIDNSDTVKTSVSYTHLTLPTKRIV